jgi:predicted house-cleaning noncanonical NTP pyrophosphatase (MazG superfamily)
MKLVRDKVADRHPQHEYDVATVEELPLLRRLKIMEEAGEVIAARNSTEEIEELADLYEAMVSFADSLNITLAEIQRVAWEKRKVLGGFDAGLVLVEYKPEAR